MDRNAYIVNPYRPGAGHAPPFLAGRNEEHHHFRRLMTQSFTTQNVLITGLRGVGKTVLLDSLRKIAEAEGWIWVGNDLSESSSISEDRLAMRILTDVSEALGRVLSKQEGGPQGAEDINDATGKASPHAFDVLRGIYERAPGLPSDRLKSTLIQLGSLVNRAKARGIVFAYDEAQCLSDYAERNEFPMSMLIETIAALQKREGVSNCLLVLSGLPQVFEQLTETRTYTERMFHVMTLERLSRQDTTEAIVNPLKTLMPPLNASKALIEKVVDLTGGYPYLIQFFGKELVDQLVENGGMLNIYDFPSAEVLDRLDAGLFAARWNRTTDKQREALRIIASRPASNQLDFSAAEIAGLAGDSVQNSHASQMLQSLCDKGLLYRTRHGRYAFTVPMSEFMILRRSKLERSREEVEDSYLSNRSHSNGMQAANGNGNGKIVDLNPGMSEPPPVPPSPEILQPKRKRRWGWMRS
jgi:AAA+ ATPase superfamily predicted ATPase